MTPYVSPPLAQIAPEAVGLGLGIGFILLLALIVLLAIGLFAFWVWMLVDCAQAPEPIGDNTRRLVWILVLVFTGWIGAILYFFLVRQPRRAGLRSRSFTSPPMPRAPGHGV